MIGLIGLDFKNKINRKKRRIKMKKVQKRLISAVLTACILATMTPAVWAADSFSDMPGDYSASALQAAVDHGLLKGTDGKLNPGGLLTRAEMAAVLVRAFGAGKTAPLTGFADVSSGAWYMEPLSAAVYMKAFQGDGSRLYPAKAITRQEAFVVLSRLLALNAGEAAVLNQFSDAASVADWAREGLAAMVKAGYVHGSAGLLNPTGSITRAEFAVVMDNIVKNYMTAAGEYTSVAEGTVMVNAPGVTLKNVTVKGDLILGDGIGEGDVTLDGVNVTGRTIVRGGGIHSFVVKGASKLGAISVTKVDGAVRVAVESGAQVEIVEIKDGKNDVLVEGKIDKLEVSAADVPVVVQKAEINTITIIAPQASVTVAKDAAVKEVAVTQAAAGTTLAVAGTVTTVTASAENISVKAAETAKITTVTATETAKGAIVDTAKGAAVGTVNAGAAGIAITGSGKVEKANVTADNVKVDTVGTTTKVDAGVTGTTSNGNDVKPGSTTTTTETKPVEKPADTGGEYVPTYTDTAWVRPDGPAGGNANYGYAAAYGDLGVTVEKATSQNNTLTIRTDAAALSAKAGAIPAAVQHAGTFYVGIQFATPSDARYAKLTVDSGAESGPINLTSDGDNAFGGKLVEYFAVSTGAQIRPDHDYAVSAKWFTDAGCTVPCTTGSSAFTVSRVVTNAVLTGTDFVLGAMNDIENLSSGSVVALATGWVQDTNLTIPTGVTLTIPAGKNFYISDDKKSATVTVNGTIVNNGTLVVNKEGAQSGTLTNNGTIQNNGAIRVNDEAGLRVAVAAGGRVVLGRTIALENELTVNTAATLDGGESKFGLTGKPITLTLPASGDLTLSNCTLDHSVVANANTGSGKLSITGNKFVLANDAYGTSERNYKFVVRFLTDSAHAFHLEFSGNTVNDSVVKAPPRTVAFLLNDDNTDNYPAAGSTFDFTGNTISLQALHLIYNIKADALSITGNTFNGSTAKVADNENAPTAVTAYNGGQHGSTVVSGNTFNNFDYGVKLTQYDCNPVGVLAVNTFSGNTTNSINVYWAMTTAGLKRAVESSISDLTIRVLGTDKILTLNENITIPAGKTVEVYQGKTLTTGEGVTLTNNGTLTCNGTINGAGTLAGSGTITGTGAWPGKT